MKFIDPKNDVAFKKVFWNDEKKEILISFLNAVLDLKEDKKIKYVEILNPYQAPKIKWMKETMLDINAKDKSWKQFIIEMQVQKKDWFEKRALYYSSKAYSKQLVKNDDYPKLNQVIFIWIVDFNIFSSKHYISRHLILNKENHKQEFKDLEFNFIELPKFKKDKQEVLKTIIEKWIYFLKNAENLKMIPQNIKDEWLIEAYEVANQHSWTEKELDVYEYWIIKDMDKRAEISYAEKEGLKKWRVEGREKGKEKGKEEAKKQLLNNLMGKMDISEDKAKEMLWI